MSEPGEGHPRLVANEPAPRPPPDGCPSCGATQTEPLPRFCGNCGARLAETEVTAGALHPRPDDPVIVLPVGDDEPELVTEPTRGPRPLFAAALLVAAVLGVVMAEALRGPTAADDPGPGGAFGGSSWNGVISEAPLATPTELIWDTVEVDVLAKPFGRLIPGEAEQPRQVLGLSATSDVVVATTLAGTFGLDRATGEIRWSRPGSESGAVGDFAFLGGPHRPHPVIVDGETGVELADLPPGAAAAAAGDDVVVAVAAGELIVVDAFTGAELWRQPRLAGRAILGVVDGVVLVFDLRTFLEAEPPLDLLEALDARTGASLWRASGVFSLAGDVVAGVALDGRLNLHDPRTGRVTQTLRRGVPPQFGEPILTTVDGVLVVAADGLVTAHDPSTGEQLWERMDVRGPEGFLFIQDGTVALVQPGSGGVAVVQPLDPRTGEILEPVSLSVPTGGAAFAQGWLLDEAATGRVRATTMTGQVLWETQLPVVALAQPVARDGRVALSDLEDVTLWDARTGQLRWRYAPADDDDPRGLAPSVLTEDAVLVTRPRANSAGSRRSVVQQLQVADGLIDWTFPRRAGPWGPVVPLPGERTAIIEFDQGIALLGPTGRRLDRAEDGGETVLVQLLELDGALVVGASTAGTSIFTAGSASTRPLERLERYAVIGDELTSRWTIDVDGCTLASSDGRWLFVPGVDGVAAIDTDIGRVHWDQALATACLPVAARDGHVVVAGLDGAVHGLAADTGDRLWRADLGSPVVQPPVIAGDEVLVTTLDQRLVAYGLEEGELRWEADLPGLVVATPTQTEGTLVLLLADGRLVGMR